MIRRPLTVAQATGRYLETFRARAKVGGIATAEGFIRAHILPALGDREVSELTKDDIDQWLRKVANKRARRGGTAMGVVCNLYTNGYNA